jgi:hypothetical protein
LSPRCLAIPSFWGFVIPAQAGIQIATLDSRLRGNDQQTLSSVLTEHQEAAKVPVPVLKCSAAAFAFLRTSKFLVLQGQLRTYLLAYPSFRSPGGRKLRTTSAAALDLDAQTKPGQAPFSANFAIFSELVRKPVPVLSGVLSNKADGEQYGKKFRKS